MGRISGPLLDRIDMHIEVPAVPFQELSANADGTSSAAMREQVSKARAVQRRRFGADNNVLNSRMTTRQLRRFCALDEAGRGLLKQAMEDLGLSARRTTASCAWPVPSPTWMAATPSGRGTSSRRSTTGVWIASYGRSRRLGPCRCGHSRRRYLPCPPFAIISTNRSWPAAWLKSAGAFALRESFPDHRKHLFVAEDRQVDCRGVLIRRATVAVGCREKRSASSRRSRVFPREKGLPVRHVLLVERLPLGLDVRPASCSTHGVASVKSVASRRYVSRSGSSPRAGNDADSAASSPAATKAAYPGARFHPNHDASSSVGHANRGVRFRAFRLPWYNPIRPPMSRRHRADL